MPFSRRRVLTHPLVLFAFGCALMLPLLGRRDIVTSHEARVAQTAREMAAAGWPWTAREVEVAPVELRRDADGVMQVEPRYDLPPLYVNPWVVPVMSGELRLKKPPLPYWCTAVLFKLAGGEREWLARLVPALLGALATPLVAGLARRLVGRRAAWVAAAVWLSSYFVVDEYRKAMADPYLAFFTLLCAWAWVRGAQHGTRRAGRMDEDGRRSSAPVSRPFTSTLVFYLSLALGFLAKGPLIVPPVAIFILAYHVCSRRPAPRGVAAHLVGLSLFAAIALPWPVAVWRAVPDAGRLWVYESGGGVTDTIENVRPWWFYLASLPQIAIPWTPALLLAFALPFLRRRGASRPAGRRFRRRLVPTAWLLLVTVAFSLSSQKKNAYLLPIAPAVALAVSQALVAVLARARLGRRKGWPGALISLQTALAIGFAVFVAVMMGNFPKLMPQSQRVVYAVVTVPMVVLCALPLLFSARPRRWIPAVAVAYAAATFLFLNLPFTDSENARSPRAFAEAVAPVLTTPGASVFTPRLPPEAAYYLPLGLRYDPSAPEVLLLVDDRRNASDRGGAAFFEARLGRQVVSAERVVIEGLPNDARWRLYRVRPAPMIAEARP